MVHERWSAEDSQERRDRIKDADVRLESWAKWSRLQASVGGASSSNWFMALAPRAKEDESQAGARHVAEGCPDEEAMEVDAVVARWLLDERYFWKVARHEYLYYGAQDAKARRLGLSRVVYRRTLDELRLALYRELDLAARKRTKRSKLVELPA